MHAKHSSGCQQQKQVHTHLHIQADSQYSSTVRKEHCLSYAFNFLFFLFSVVPAAARGYNVHLTIRNYLQDLKNPNSLDRMDIIILLMQLALESGDYNETKYIFLWG